MTDVQNINIELVQFDDSREGIKVEVEGDIDTLTKMLFSAMLNNAFLASVVITASEAYKKQNDEYKKVLLN